MSSEETKSSPRWYELTARAEREAVESVSELFAEYGYNQGVVVEEPIVPGEDGGGTIDPKALVIVRTYLPLDIDEVTPATDDNEETHLLSTDEKVRKLQEGIWHLGRLRRIEPLEIVEKREEDWANAWKEFYQVHRIGRRSVIKPPWQEFTPQPDDIVIELDPGMAFGTGLHPTTRLCLELLEDYLPQYQKYQKYQNTDEANLNQLKVLDLGTGSGVLAIAAQKLGAGSVYALDTDPVAVKVAREKFERNNLLTQIQAEVGSIAVVPGSTDGFYAFADDVQRTPNVITQAMPFDIVVANIIARIITALAPALAAALHPGGLLIVSGIINNHADETQAALETVGFQILQRLEEDDWVAMVGRLDTNIATAQGQSA
jgi:ribosomal protein L11 methyltransferase